MNMSGTTPGGEQDAMVDAIADGLAHPSRSPLLRTPGEAGLDYDDVFYPSADGVPLEAWYIPATGSTRLIVSMHAFGFSRYGYPGHLEPWKSAFGPGNDTEIDLIEDYRILHDAGYNVLAFDFRNFGLSAAANGGVASNNRFETRDVVGTLAYIRSRPDLAAMTLGIFARCMGANVTFRAIHTAPDAFTDVRALVAPLLLSPLVFAQTALDAAGLGDRIDELDKRFRILASASLSDGTTSAWAPAVRIPTLTYGVHDDHLTRPADLQSTFDAIGAADKELFWIRDTPRRWDGYTWFQRHPERILAWLDARMS